MPSVESGHDASVVTEKSSAGIATIRINRPDKLNALDRKAIRDLESALKAVADDCAVMAVILTGAGSAFCVGGDISEFPAGDPAAEFRGAMRELLESAASLVLLVKRLPQVVIAAVNGPAIGGGMALAMAADVRICAETAYFSTTFIKLGLCGFEMGLSVLLPEVAGSGAAFDLAASGRRIGAQEAGSLHIVQEVVEGAALLPRAEAIADSYAKNGQRGIRLTKQLMNDDLALNRLEKAMRAEIEAQLQCIGSAENRAAVASLMRKTR